MPKTVDYYISLASPYTYMGGKRLPALVQATGATFVVKPVKGGELLPATGGLPVAKRHPARLAYRLVELARWRDHWSLPMNIQPKFFPVDDSQAAHMVIAAKNAGQDALALSNVFLACVWEKEANIADVDTLIAAANAADFDGPALAAQIGNDKIAAEYDANTKEAIERQVFGMPFFIYQGIPYWGQDRIEFLERALKGQ
jgi:2-hydroxychromene-2-carboxylate isomerase